MAFEIVKLTYLLTRLTDCMTELQGVRIPLCPFLMHTYCDKPITYHPRECTFV